MTDGPTIHSPVAQNQLVAKVLQDAQSKHAHVQESSSSDISRSSRVASSFDESRAAPPATARARSFRQGVRCRCRCRRQGRGGGGAAARGGGGGAPARGGLHEHAELVAGGDPPRYPAERAGGVGGAGADAGAFVFSLPLPACLPCFVDSSWRAGISLLSFGTRRE